MITCQVNKTSIQVEFKERRNEKNGIFFPHREYCVQYCLKYRYLESINWKATTYMCISYKNLQKIKKNSISNSMFIPSYMKKNHKIIKAFTKMFWGLRFLLTKKEFQNLSHFQGMHFLLHNFSYFSFK